MTYVNKYNVMESEFCDQIVDSVSDADYLPHQWYGNGHKGGQGELELTPDNMGPDICFNRHPDLQQQLIEKCWEAMEAYNIDYFFNFEDQLKINITILTPPRINRYDVGQDMKVHNDLIHVDESHTKVHPKLSLVGLLNDDFSGGDFKLVSETIDFSKGDILVFPSNFMYTHLVTKVTQGKRFSFVAWAY